ncbi:chromatin remodeling complex subunit, partial [Genlisea aurea]
KDEALFSALGVTSASVEDVECRILEEVPRKDEEDGMEAHRGREKETLDRKRNELKAIKREIDAVASSVEQLENLKRDDGGNETAKTNSLESSRGDRTLQLALASDRLESLMKRKTQLEKEISASVSTAHRKLIQDIVKEESVAKWSIKEAEKTCKGREKRLKKVSIGDDDDFDDILNAASSGLIETERDALIRKGVLTPFHKLKGYERRLEGQEQLQQSVNSENGREDHDLASTSIARTVQLMAEASKARPSTKLLDPESAPKLDPPCLPFKRLRKPLMIPESLQNKSVKESEIKKRRRQPIKKWSKKSPHQDEIQEGVGEPSSEGDDCLDAVEEATDQNSDFVTLEGGLKIPGIIFHKLFDYQKVGVQWLWELHCQKAGGIIGDEMGLGKTIQVLAFLGSLHFSGMYRPSIIVCPVTLLRQWQREATKWYSSFHTELLHDSAGESSRKRKKPRFSDDESSLDSGSEEKPSPLNSKKWDSLINRVLRSDSGLLITTYEQLRLHGDKLLDIEWGYAVLDEGHRIRNPNAEITLVCKQLQTVHRIIMTGAPIQNKLSELWSLFDFVFPGKLGVLPVFEAEFAVPISVGGYANATPLQVSTAYRCAVVLRDLIMPYLLRRMKVDVDAQLPKKTEHVLFCSLTPEQRSVYRSFLSSSEVEQIVNGSRNSLYGIDVMRKICNHPDLLEREHCDGEPDYGNPIRSGKMKLVAEVLKMWKVQGHRVLLFSQTQQMLDIIEQFLTASDYDYRRMDGSTPVKQRMALIDEFNNSDDVFIFILTTKVGGLGTNLTGANRVIIFDPDWNPSTDMQARERAWRIGQKKDVTVYRLITRGTIEEKVYQRQIYKHFLTNKILRNPQQRRFFKSRELKDLFTLNDDGDGCSTETSSIFSQVSELTIVGTHNEEQKNLNGSVNEAANGSELKSNEEVCFLQGLFEAHGIHSAMNHDAIMESHDENKTKVEEEATKIAQRASEALLQSRIIRRRESISVPTWTGKSGAAGAPMQRKFGSTLNSELITTTSTSSTNAGASSGRALSSAELLMKLKKTEENAIADSLSTKSKLHPEVLTRQIRSFIQRKGGSATSVSIVSEFKERIPSEDLPLFKNLLKEIATLEESHHWILKPEHR